MTVVGIASAGASAFFEAADACRHVAFALVTDRDCAAERAAIERGMPHERLPYESAGQFSRDAAQWIARLPGCDLAIALYDRVLAPPLVGGLPILNVHPSLLPAFPGMGALAAARAAGVKRFGATLHGMTMEIDRGPIVAQVSTAMEPGETLARMEKKSFIHKLYLILLAIDLLERQELRFERGLPVLADGPRLRSERYLAHVEAVQAREGVKAL